jgi:regulator of replication initiation timing
VSNQQYQDAERAARQAENDRLQRLQDQQMAMAQEQDAKRNQKMAALDKQTRYDQLKRDWENKFHCPYPYPPPY